MPHIACGRPGSTWWRPGSNTWTRTRGPERLETLFEAEILPSWPPGEYNRHAIAFFRDRLMKEGEAVADWYVWYAIRRATAGDSAALVACGGYFGPPLADGTVEIGYSVVPEWRRHGYATELVQALTKRAFDVRRCGESSRSQKWKTPRRLAFSRVAASEEWERDASPTMIGFNSIATADYRLPPRNADEKLPEEKLPRMPHDRPRPRRSPVVLRLGAIAAGAMRVGLHVEDRQLAEAGGESGQTAPAQAKASPHAFSCSTAST